MVYIERALPCQSGWLCQLKIGFGPNPFSFLFNYTYAYGGAGAGGGGTHAMYSIFRCSWLLLAKCTRFIFKRSSLGQ